MADRARRNPHDQGGDWFVDTTCIDCDVARQLAPGLIDLDERGLSYFTREPATTQERLMAWRALLACPTGSIGAPAGEKAPEEAFPYEVAPRTYLTGYNARDTFGANAYLMVRPAGNLLVDAPRWVPRLADRLEELGGVAHVLLTHRDDVGAYDRYAERFGARVWVHEADADAAPDATDVLGDAAVDVAPGVRAHHVPGHTRGSVMYAVDDTYLFTGDSLAWSRTHDDLVAFRSATWYSWQAQTESLARLAEQVRFEWVLPGHGSRGHGSADEMHERLLALVQRMRADTVEDAW